MEGGRPGVPGLIPRTQHQHPVMTMGGGGSGGGGRHSLPLPGSSNHNQMKMLVPRRSTGSGSSGGGGKLMRLRCRFRPLHDTYVKGGCSIDESADVIFLCGDGHQVKAHKVILASSSKFFANMFDGQPVGEISVVNVPDVRVDILKLILQLTYRDRVIIDSQQLQDVGDYLGMFGLAWGQFVYEDYIGDEPQTSVPKSPIPIKPVELPRKIIYVQRNPAGSPQGQQQGVRQVITTGNSNERLPLQQVSNGTVDPIDHQQQLQQAQAERHSRKSKLTTRAGIEGEDIVEQEGEDDPDNLTRDWMSRLGKKEPPPNSNTNSTTQNQNVGGGGAQPIKRMRTSEEQLPQQQREQNVCSVCNTRFQTEVAWLWHEERHVGANMFKCKFCDHLAKTPKLCYVHEKQDHGYSGLHATGIPNPATQNVSTNSAVNANSNSNCKTNTQQRVVIRTPAPTQTTRPIQISQQIKKRVQMANLNLKKFQAQKQLAAVKHAQFGIGESTGVETLDNKKVKQLHWLYVCEKCNNCADSTTKAATHYEQCYPDKEKEFVNTVTKYRQGFYGNSMCPLCPRHYPHNNGYMIHCGHHHPQYRRLCTLTGGGNDEQLKCNNCKECFADPSAFHEHLQVGPGQGQFYCDEEPIEEPNDEPPKLSPKEKLPPASAAKHRGPGRPPNTGGKPRIKRPESPMESKAQYKVQFHTPPRSARLASRVQAEASAEAAAAAAAAASKVKPQPEDDQFPPVDCPVCGDSDLPNISLHLETKHKDLNVNVQRISAELLRCKGCTITFDICDLLDHKNCLQETESPAETEAESDTSSRRSSTGIGRPPVKPVIVDAESLPPGIGRSPIERIEIDDLHSIEAIRSALKCLICGQTAKRLGVIAECLRSHGVHRCALCFNSYISKTDYGQHLRKCHGSGSNKLKCPLCPKAFANAGQTSGHMYSTHWLQILKENELALAKEEGVENEDKSAADDKTNGSGNGEGSENKGKEILIKTENDSKKGTEKEADEGNSKVEVMNVSKDGSEMEIDESVNTVEELVNDAEAEVVAGNVLNNSDQDLKSDE